MPLLRWRQEMKLFDRSMAIAEMVRVKHMVRTIRAFSRSATQTYSACWAALPEGDFPA
jgi:hypothetical protein